MKQQYHFELRTYNAIGLLTGILLFLRSIPVYSVIEGDSPGKTAACTDYLFINGRSNVNSFTFSYYSRYSGNQIPASTSETHDEINIDIPVAEFEPSNPMMYNDFLRMLRANDYPLIRISLPDKPFYRSVMNIPDADIFITIAGVTNRYKISCNVSDCFNKLFISGSKTIRLTDFNLVPPEKLYGLIKVKNEIDVHFGFILTFIDRDHKQSVN